MIMDTVIDSFVKQSEEILKDNLVGIYLHGSAVMGCYNPAKSDLDLIVVVKEHMTDADKKTYMDMVVELNSKGPAKGIEMSIVMQNACKPFVYPTPFELHFSVSLKFLHLLSCLLLHSQLTCGTVENKIFKNPSGLCPSLS